MSECNHDKRFHLMGATNGCCACHAEQLAERLAAAEAEREANDDEHHNLVADLVTQRDRARAKLAVAQARCSEGGLQ
jgi:hypothetical protein